MCLWGPIGQASWGVIFWYFEEDMPLWEALKFLKKTCTEDPPLVVLCYAGILRAEGLVFWFHLSWEFWFGFSLHEWPANYLQDSVHTGQALWGELFCWFVIGVSVLFCAPSLGSEREVDRTHFGFVMASLSTLLSCSLSHRVTAAWVAGAFFTVSVLTFASICYLFCVSSLAICGLLSSYIPFPPGRGISNHTEHLLESPDWEPFLLPSQDMWWVLHGVEMSIFYCCCLCIYLSKFQQATYFPSNVGTTQSKTSLLQCILKRSEEDCGISLFKEKLHTFCEVDWPSMK